MYARLLIALAVVVGATSCESTKKTPVPVDTVVGNSVGQRAPEFTLPDIHGSPTTLSSLRPRWVVLVFYRGHW